MPSNRVESRRAVHEHNRVIVRPCEKIIFPFVWRRTRVDLRPFNREEIKSIHYETVKTDEKEKKKKKRTYPLS